jgi:MFS family permease
MSAENLDPIEKRAAMGLAGVFAMRMLGLFLILPVFALFADQLGGATPVTIGLAIGAYGLTQALMQIPFGVLSDRIGRKPVIVMGLLLFAAGSVVAALSTSIEGVILGRLLQGSGAIAAAIMALAADLTKETSRTRVMAIIGMSIGMAFITSLIIGPLLAVGLGLSGIFWITACLALGGIAIVIWVVPRPDHCVLHRDAEPVPAMVGQAITHPNLFRLNSGVFILHLTLTAVFLVVPLELRDTHQLQVASHWQVYLPVMLLAMGLMVPFVIIAEKRQRMKEMLLLAVGVAGASLLLMGLLNSDIMLFSGVMVLFFAAFNLAEAIMPSWVSKVAAAEMRGTAMGVFASSQFAGAFMGGLLGGWVQHRFGDIGVFLFAAGMMCLWLLLLWGIQRPRHLANYLFHLNAADLSDVESLRQRLLGLDGVASVQVIAGDGIAYMKVDNKQFDSSTLQAITASQTG